jgi:hypothetical protein
VWRSDLSRFSIEEFRFWCKEKGLCRGICRGEPEMGVYTRTYTQPDDAVEWVVVITSLRFESDSRDRTAREPIADTNASRYCYFKGDVFDKLVGV